MATTDLLGTTGIVSSTMIKLMQFWLQKLDWLHSKCIDLFNKSNRVSDCFMSTKITRIGPTTTRNLLGTGGRRVDAIIKMIQVWM